jgi:hypothetical protein
MKEERPWGYFEVLEDNMYYKIKKIVVNDGHRTSLQYHNEKIETWIYKDGTMHTIKPGECHRLVGPIELLEVSHGLEEDIVRIKDDYGRAKKRGVRI